VRSLTRACLAWGIGTLDARVKPVDHATRTWPSDRDVPLLLKAAVSANPGLRDEADILSRLTTHFLAALAPQSAAALDRMNADAERRSRFLPDADDCAPRRREEEVLM
jgi:hypothetical protein